MGDTTNRDDDNNSKDASLCCCSIGVDIGGTHMLGILMDENGTVLCSEDRSISAEERKDVDGIVSSLVDCLEVLVSKATAARDDNKTTIVGIGLGIPGNVDPEKGCTRYLPNFGWLDEVPLESILRTRLSQQQPNNNNNNNSNSSSYNESMWNNIQMRNDGRCAALAERMALVDGSTTTEQQHKNFCMMTLGTGIGGAFLHGKDATLLDGCSYDAGDFGHHVICSGTDAFECVCGKSGCFETHASAAGLVRHYNRLSSSNASLDDAKFVMDLLTQNDDTNDDNGDSSSNSLSIAQQAFENYLNDLSTGIANAITFYNPSIVVLGGKLGQNERLYQPYNNQTLEQRVDAKTLPATRGKCQIVPARLSNAGAIGAAYLPLLYKKHKPTP